MHITSTGLEQEHIYWNMKKYYLIYPTQECKGGPMHLNEYGPAESVRTYAIISRYLSGIVQHTQTPFILEYEEV